MRSPTSGTISGLWTRSTPLDIGSTHSLGTRHIPRHQHYPRAAWTRPSHGVFSPPCVDGGASSPPVCLSHSDHQQSSLPEALLGPPFPVTRGPLVAFGSSQNTMKLLYFRGRTSSFMIWSVWMYLLRVFVMTHRTRLCHTFFPHPQLVPSVTSLHQARTLMTAHHGTELETSRCPRMAQHRFHAGTVRHKPWREVLSMPMSLRAQTSPPSCSIELSSRPRCTAASDDQFSRNKPWRTEKRFRKLES
jgi:hypothetical protein